MTDERRGTGRTTRMIVSVLQKALEGENVLVVSHSKAHAVSIVKKVKDILWNLNVPVEHMDAFHVTIVGVEGCRMAVIRAASLKELCDEPGKPSVYKGSDYHVFIDHSAYVKRRTIKPFENIL